MTSSICIKIKNPGGIYQSRFRRMEARNEPPKPFIAILISATTTQNIQKSPLSPKTHPLAPIPNTSSPKINSSSFSPCPSYPQSPPLYNKIKIMRNYILLCLSFFFLLTLNGQESAIKGWVRDNVTEQGLVGGKAAGGGDHGHGHRCRWPFLHQRFGSGQVPAGVFLYGVQGGDAAQCAHYFG